MKSLNKESGETAMRRRDGMEAVIDMYQTPLLRYAAHLLNNATLAQDAVQNALVKLFRQWQAGMRPDDRLKSWLFRVVHNEAVDLIRSEERRRRHQEGHVAVMMAETSGGLHEDPLPDERASIVLRCLGVLNPAQRQVVLLRMQQGLSYEEISAVTGQSTGYVGNLLHTAVLKLSEEVRRMEGGAR
ncbi:MAG: RNA polymerase sigma factor [bacterium]